MGKGGGGGGQQAPAPTTSTVNQSNLPAYAEPFFTRLLERTEEESNAPYIPFEGERIQQFGPDTTQGFSDIRNIAGSGTPQEFTDASSALTGVAGQGPLAQQAQFGDVRSYTDPGVSGQYINPYIQNALDVQKARLNERFGEQRLDREAQAVGQGAFTNVRRDVQEQIAQRELNRQQNEIEAQGLAQAYESGANIFNLERQADLQNRALNTEVFAGNLTRGLEQGRVQSAAAEQLRAQGLAGDELGFGRAKSLAGVGGAFDDLSQQGLDIAYRDFQNQRDFPRQQLNYYSGILRGVPIQPNQESRTYQAPPSQLSQLLGLGVGGLGLAKALG
tara:strand:- start:195 stop:1190 length:996 start_codon:yes stop_codon:yes gene_type:complete